MIYLASLPSSPSGASLVSRSLVLVHFGSFWFVLVGLALHRSQLGLFGSDMNKYALKIYTHTPTHTPEIGSHHACTHQLECLNILVNDEPTNFEPDEAQMEPRASRFVLANTNTNAI